MTAAVSQMLLPCFHYQQGFTIFETIREPASIGSGHTSYHFAHLRASAPSPLAGGHFKFHDAP